MIKQQAQSKGITIKSIIDDKIPPLISSDNKRIKQVLLNLLSNALKFTAKGSIKINASLISVNNTISED
jgi:signal transduction histidine kinase